MFKAHVRCKVCNLPEEIMKEVHYWRFIENMPVHKITERLNALVVEKGLEITKFYPTGVNRHFKNHLNPDLVAAYVQQIPPHLTRRSSSVPLEKIQSVEDHLAAIVAPENLEVFERLRDNMENLSNHLEVIDAMLPTKESLKEKNDQFDVSVNVKDAYEMYIKMTKEHRATLNDLAKFLNLKSILRTFVEELLREYTHKVTSAFLEEMRYLKEEVAPNDHLASITMKEVATNFATKLANATDKIIDRLDRIIQTHMK